MLSRAVLVSDLFIKVTSSHYNFQHAPYRSVHPCFQRSVIFMYFFISLLFRLAVVWFILYFCQNLRSSSGYCNERSSLYYPSAAWTFLLFMSSMQLGFNNFVRIDVPKKFCLLLQISSSLFDITGGCRSIVYESCWTSKSIVNYSACFRSLKLRYYSR